MKTETFHGRKWERMNFLSRYTGRILRHRRRYGVMDTLLFLATRIIRWRRYVVFEACLETPRSCTRWDDGEQLKRIGPDEVEEALTPEVRAFLGGESAVEHIEGVHQGNQLFIVTNNGEIQHCGYILFHTRQTKILGEEDHPPLIASCLTAPRRADGVYIAKP